MLRSAQGDERDGHGSEGQSNSLCAVDSFAQHEGSQQHHQETGDRGAGGAALQHLDRGAHGADERDPADNVCDKGIARELVIMLAPFVPHFAEECWERLGHTESVFEARWPAWDEGLVVEDRVEVVVQVNGKTRSKVSVARDAGEETVVAAALRDAAVARFVEGKGVRKRVYVANRLLNLVVG
jgi:leucyl-tRNA synthetase